MRKIGPPRAATILLANLVLGLLPSSAAQPQTPPTAQALGGPVRQFAEAYNAEAERHAIPSHAQLLGCETQQNQPVCSYLLSGEVVAITRATNPGQNAITHLQLRLDPNTPLTLLLHAIDVSILMFSPQTGDLERDVAVKRFCADRVGAVRETTLHGVRWQCTLADRRVSQIDVFADSTEPTPQSGYSDTGAN